MSVQIRFSQLKHYCDHGHETMEARYLPCGSNSGVYVCLSHYHAELQNRVDSNAWDITNSAHFPAWELLKVQETA